FVAAEDGRESARKTSGNIPQIHSLSRAGWKLHLKGVPGEVVKLLQGFNQQKIDRKPDRPAPVGISAEQAGCRFRRLVIDALLIAVDRQTVRVLVVIARQRAHAVR